MGHYRMRKQKQGSLRINITKPIKGVHDAKQYCQDEGNKLSLLRGLTPTASFALPTDDVDNEALLTTASVLPPALITTIWDEMMHTAPTIQLNVTQLYRTPSVRPTERNDCTNVDGTWMTLASNEMRRESDTDT